MSLNNQSGGMNMTLELQSIANLAEIISGIAVVVSLVYLAMQVRQNTHSLRTENYARALDRVAAIQAELSKGGEVSRVFIRGVIDASKLTPEERIQFTWSLYEIFGAFEFMYHAAQTRALSDEVWERWSSAVAWWLAYPGVQSWWHAQPTPFSTSFAAYVAKTIQNNPSDKAASERWRIFVEGDKR